MPLKEILIGTMLGDLYIQKTSKQGNFRLKFEMTSRNTAYMLHIYEIFKVGSAIL